MDYTAHGILQARILEWVVFPFSRGSSQPRDGTQVSHTAGEFFTSWATGKHMNTGVGSLSLLHIPTQELNWGLLHSRWILYKLSYQRSPCLSRYLVDTDYSTANFPQKWQLLRTVKTISRVNLYGLHNRILSLCIKLQSTGQNAIEVQGKTLGETESSPDPHMWTLMS